MKIFVAEILIGRDQKFIFGHTSNELEEKIKNYLEENKLTEEDCFKVCRSEDDITEWYRGKVN